MLNIKEIQELIPHRYPFLLVDRVLEVEAGERAVAIKNVTFNEPFFRDISQGIRLCQGY